MSFRDRLKEGAVRTLAFVNVADPALVELAGHVGFDAVIIDAEHGPLCMHDVVELVRAAQTAGCHSMVRVPMPDRAWILRSLDAGADGVLVPQVESSASAAAVVSEVRYPPAGQRGAGFYARRHRYALDRGRAALDNSDASVAAGVQIESVSAVKAAEEIVHTPGVDYVFVGPTDLSVSHGSCDADDPWVQHALASVARVCSEGRVPCGVYAAGPEAAERYFEMGYGSVAIGLVPLLANAGSAFIRGVREAARAK